MKKINFDFIIGPAYKAIPLAATISLLLKQNYNTNIRWGYDRKEEKEYGVLSEKWLIGKIINGDRLLIVDDVATTGKTKIDLIKKIKFIKKDFNIDFEAVLILLDRQELDDEGKYVGDVLKSYGVKLFSLLKIDDVFNYLRDNPVSGEYLVKDEKYNQYLEYKKKYGI